MNGWSIKINIKLAKCPDGTQIPPSLTVKYLGLTLDRRLTRAPPHQSRKTRLKTRLRMVKTINTP